MDETTPKKKKVGLKTILRVVVVLGLMGFAGWSFFKYQQAQEAVDKLSNPEAQEEVIAKERGEILAKVGKLMILPENEEPIIQTINNAETLSQSQAFLKDVSDGDVLIVYVQSGKSIIYSPEKNIIVNVGSISVQGNNTAQLDTENPLKVEIRAGGGSEELVNTVAEQLANLVDLTSVSEAASQDYQGSVAIVLTTDEERLEQAKIFASRLRVQLIAELPEGEAESDAEVVLIVGN